MSLADSELVDPAVAELLARGGLLGVVAQDWREFDDTDFCQDSATTAGVNATRCDTDGPVLIQGILPGFEDAAPTTSRGSLTPLYDVVARAYSAVSMGWAADRVIADPVRDYEFVRRCWRLGAEASAFELNWALLNARKGGKLSGLTSAARYSMDRATLDQFTFASEFALRALQERYYFEKHVDVSLDRVLCDPRLANEFEELARQVKPGHSSFEYRWAVILLRKARRTAAKETTCREWFKDVGRTDQIRLAELPTTPGLYWFQAETGPLFIGETLNLRLQVDRHFQATGTLVVPEIARCRRPQWARLAVLEIPDRASSRRERLKGTLLPALKPRLNYLSGTMGSLLGVA